MHSKCNAHKDVTPANALVDQSGRLTLAPALSYSDTQLLRSAWQALRDIVRQKSCRMKRIVLQLTSGALAVPIYRFARYSYTRRGLSV
jgi:hypothetical protein